MEFLTLGNLWAHAIQALMLGALGTLIAFLLPIDSATVRYAYWRALLVGCVTLPWIQLLVVPAADPLLAVPSTVSSVATAALETATATTSARSATLNWRPWLAVILVGGVLSRAIWMMAGLLSLRRLRRLGERATDSDVEDLQTLLGTRADVRYVQGLQQPATFGLLRPVVLLPDGLRTEGAEIRRALICHELFHVQRRDWAWVIGEELLLAGFWFNPAVWWVVARVRLAREESVDELAVLATGSRRTYVRALLAYAEKPALAPAPAFAERRHLFHRITLISKEAVMSSRRIVFSCAVMALLLVSGSWYAAQAFPLVAEATPASGIQQAGPVERRSNPITATNPVPRRTDYRAPEYPVEARVMEAHGMVHLRVTVDEVGRVAEARRLGFTLGSSNLDVGIGLSDPSPENIAKLMEKVVLRGKDGRVADMRTILGIIEAFTQAATLAVMNWRYEAPVNGPVAFDVKVYFKADGETSALQGSSAPTPTRGAALDATARPLNAPPNAVRVGGNIKAPIKITDVRPEYPAIAQSARVSGMVIIEAVIGTDGTVTDARVLRSIPLLDQAALDAVWQWRFTPTHLNGAPVPVIMTVTVNFTLQ